MHVKQEITHCHFPGLAIPPNDFVRDDSGDLEVA